MSQNLPDFSLKRRGFWQRQPIRANIPKSTSVSTVFFANDHNFKILTFDLEPAQTVQNKKK
jgi:hypothetical protein